MNLFVNKMFENVGGLVYEEVDDSDKCIFQVKGVRSALGEVLTFSEVSISPVLLMNMHQRCSLKVEWIIFFLAGDV